MRFAGEFAALGTAVCWAFGSNLFAAAGQRMGSVVLNRLRLTVAMLLLGTALLVTHGSPWPTWATSAQVTLLALSGLVGFVFGDLYYFRALVILGPGRAALITSMSPIFTLLIGWPVLGEKPGPLVLLGVALILGGITWVLLESERGRRPHVEGSVTVGIVAGVLAAVGQAGGYVLSKMAMRTGIDPLSGTVIRVVAATVGIWLLAALQRDVGRSLGALRDGRAAAFMAGGAFFGPFLGVTLSLAALQFVEAGVAAAITSIYPVLTLALSSHFHHERFTLRNLLGALVAAAGVVVLFLR
ncbi:MAG TPA: DMT family transporter [Thermoanaerobaculaceae bacterium]|nr:DMT family transporter [Thermoanaerobaculaceae bacterium]